MNPSRCRGRIAVPAGLLAALLLFPAWLSPLIRDCLCGHDGDEAAVHAAAGCSCPIHAGRDRQGAGDTGRPACHGAGAAPAESGAAHCSLAPTHPVPTGFVFALEALSRVAVLALAVAPVPPPTAEPVVESAQGSELLETPVPPTPPPRAPFRSV